MLPESGEEDVIRNGNPAWSSNPMGDWKSGIKEAMRGSAVN